MMHHAGVAAKLALPRVTVDELYASEDLDVEEVADSNFFCLLDCYSSFPFKAYLTSAVRKSFMAFL